MVGIESEYFVYTRYHTYVCEMNLVCAYHIFFVLGILYNSCVCRGSVIIELVSRMNSQRGC